jgi:hypothetical protein
MGLGEPHANWRSTLATKELVVSQEAPYLPHTKSVENLAVKSINSGSLEHNAGSTAKTDRGLFRNNPSSKTQSQPYLRITPNNQNQNELNQTAPYEDKVYRNSVKGQ